MYYLDLDLEKINFYVIKEDMDFESLKDLIEKNSIKYLKIDDIQTSFNKIHDIKGLEIIFLDFNRSIELIYNMPDLKYVKLLSTNVEEIFMCPSIKAISSHLDSRLVISPTLTSLEEFHCFETGGYFDFNYKVSLKYVRYMWYTLDFNHISVEKLDMFQTNLTHNQDYDELDYDDINEQDITLYKMINLKELTGDISLKIINENVLNNLQFLELLPYQIIEIGKERYSKFSEISDKLINLKTLKFSKNMSGIVNTYELNIPEKLKKLEKIYISENLKDTIILNHTTKNIEIIYFDD